MKLIAAADKNWGIGKNGNLLYNIPDDMRFFREKTAGKTVIMGRATLESLPGGKPLPKRRNIILSKTLSSVEGAEVLKSVDEIHELFKGGSDDVFVIGGESVYRDLLPLCDTAYITRIEAVSDADRHLVNLDEATDWQMAEASPVYASNGVCFRFVTYKRK